MNDTQYTSVLVPYSLGNSKQPGFCPKKPFTKASKIHKTFWTFCLLSEQCEPSRPCLKNCQNTPFWSVHGIWKFFGLNDFIWGAMKVPFSDFIQKMSQAPASSVQVLIREDKLDYLKNPLQDFKNSFCLGFLWISRITARQNLKGPLF